MKRALALLFLSAVAACATTVTGTIKGSDGAPFALGTYSITLVNAAGQPFYLGSLPVNTPRVIAGTLDATGSLSELIVPNATITAGTQWMFRVCSAQGRAPFNGAPQCFSQAVTIAGSSQSVSSVLSAAAPSLAVVVPSFILPADPVVALQAATKQYVDSHGGGGAAATVTVSPTGSPLTASTAGFYVNGSAGAFTYNLPAITTLGVSYLFTNGENGAGIITLRAPAGVHFVMFGGAGSAAGSVVSPGSLGDSISVVAISSTQYFVWTTGTWTPGA